MGFTANPMIGDSQPNAIHLALPQFLAEEIDGDQRCDGDCS
jgi:hypothetical protein